MSKLLVSFLIFCNIFSSNFIIVHSQSTFNVLQYGAVGDGRFDDSEAFLEAWDALCEASDEANATTTPTLVVPAEKEFLLQPLRFSGPCNPNSVHVEILGKIVASGPEKWSACDEDSWIAFSEVTNLTINGTGEINGRGSNWWSFRPLDHLINVNKIECKRPKALQFYKCDYLQLSGLTHRDSQKAQIGINSCNNVTISSIRITAPEDSPNTDGIDISMSSYVNIHDSTIGTGDDCIAINNGSSHINITNITCGPGHGISVGSLGEGGANETVEEVHVRNCTFNGTTNGARIKTWEGGSGYVKKVSFKQITLIETKNPIIIDQHYSNDGGDDRRKPGASAVYVSNVTYSEFAGTCANEEAIILDCSNTPGCHNIVMNKINITSTIPGKQILASCSNVNGTSNATNPTVTCLQQQQ